MRGRVARALEEFVQERDWVQVHTPENLAKSIDVEAGDLLEGFRCDEDGTTHAFVRNSRTL